AEDGIRDRNVTGVQTCALPISLHSPRVLVTVHCSPSPASQIPLALRSVQSSLSLAGLPLEPSKKTVMPAIPSSSASWMPLPLWSWNLWPCIPRGGLTLKLSVLESLGEKALLVETQTLYSPPGFGVSRNPWLSFP